MVTAYFESNKNTSDGFEYPFYVSKVGAIAEGYRIFYHWHYHIELLYFISGNASVFIGDKIYKISPGSLVFISPSQIHAVFIEKNQPTEHYVVGFDSELFDPLVGPPFNIKYLLLQISNWIYIHEAMIFSKLDQADLVPLMDEMCREYRQKGIGFQLAVTSGIQKLIFYILRALDKKGLSFTSNDENSKSKMNALHKALTYIDDHFCENITPQDISKICVISYSYLSKLFKSVIHMPMTSYINHLRMRKAEQLLLNPEMNITEIALNTGFSNSSYFIEQFKRANGISPKQYRKRILENVTGTSQDSKAYQKYVPEYIPNHAHINPCSKA